MLLASFVFDGKATAVHWSCNAVFTTTTVMMNSVKQLPGWKTTVKRLPYRLWLTIGFVETTSHNFMLQNVPASCNNTCSPLQVWTYRTQLMQRHRGRERERSDRCHVHGGRHGHVKDRDVKIQHGLFRQESATKVYIPISQSKISI